MCCITPRCLLNAVSRSSIIQAIRCCGTPQWSGISFLTYLITKINLFNVERLLQFYNHKRCGVVRFGTQRHICYVHLRQSLTHVFNIFDSFFYFLKKRRRYYAKPSFTSFEVFWS